MHPPSLLFLAVLPLASALNAYRSLLTDCLNAAQVPILLSSSAGWSQEIQAYNLRLTPTPTVVAMVRNLADVRILSVLSCLPLPRDVK